MEWGHGALVLWVFRVELEEEESIPPTFGAECPNAGTAREPQTPAAGVDAGI